MFPGLGDHYVNMGKGLYQTEPVFKKAVDTCCELCQPLLETDLWEVLYPSKASPKKKTLSLRELMGRGEQPKEAISAKINQTIYAHLTVFIVEYALSKLWIDRGIRPHAMIGQSLGEYVAACVSGVFSLKNSLRILLERAKLIEVLPPGGMLALYLPEQDLLSMLPRELSLAVVGTPSTCIVAGPEKSISEFETSLLSQKIVCRRLPVTHAFHSDMMLPIKDKFIAFMKQITPLAPTIPYISNVTGTWITDRQINDWGYWCSHVCQTVRFADGIGELLKKPKALFLEVGPGQGLSSFVFQHPDAKNLSETSVLSSLPGAYESQPDETFWLSRLHKLNSQIGPHKE